MLIAKRCTKMQAKNPRQIQNCRANFSGNSSPGIFLCGIFLRLIFLHWIFLRGNFFRIVSRRIALCADFFNPFARKLGLFFHIFFESLEITFFVLLMLTVAHAKLTLIFPNVVKIANVAIRAKIAVVPCEHSAKHDSPSRAERKFRIQFYSRPQIPIFPFIVLLIFQMKPWFQIESHKIFQAERKARRGEKVQRNNKHLRRKLADFSEIISIRIIERHAPHKIEVKPFVEIFQIVRLAFIKNADHFVVPNKIAHSGLLLNSRYA